MKRIIYLPVLLCIFVFSCKKDKQARIETQESKVKISPITHGTLVLEFEDTVIYIDPVGGAEAFIPHKKPTHVLITDIHGDHLDVKTLEALDLNNTTLVITNTVSKNLPELAVKERIILNNGESKQLETLAIKAIPMYNLRKEALKYHSKGRGNGYVITLGDERIYISGDTEDIPEMRALKNIDIAFVCMNLPYTMTVESAASAVLDFKPKTVYPYHYRGTAGLSDINLFKKLVESENQDINVVQLDWY